MSGDVDIYQPGVVTSLFDEMSKTYGVTNYVASLGFCKRWRRHAVAGARLAPGLVVVELMSGGGECWRFLRRGMQRSGRLVAYDLSPEMCRLARQQLERLGDPNIELVEGDALATRLPDGVADRVVASFGLKTFSARQLEQLAGEVWRLLKPGGAFSFVEIATPRARWLRRIYFFYLRHVIPLVGQIFLGNPDNYRMLARYTEAFAAGEAAFGAFERAGFQVTREELFAGCAMRLTGQKPAVPAI